ncbi:mitochondrial import inner membrane translocase subunit TIM44 [Bombyx mandarina]|uniref:Mitochondrial import inner membrane translocase subunit TIM44 n=2 Tax=Bombyx TaxID=7090 RepID=A0A8R2ATN2_BOMMO|nr:mitochondrial import inner membrane translocase subunit TIM44 [Bombyx mori]XP_028026443.1 mitochondrial import inner membrane translocase subunit TIM44 [Bombyx mandarina]
MHAYRQLLYSPARWKCVLPSSLKTTSLSAKSDQYTIQECRQYSARKGFFSSIIENIKEDIAKNKEMKENIKKFREEAQKLENSEALQAARKKFHAVESEASKSSEVLKETIEGIKGKMEHVLEEASKSDIAKKAGKITEDISKTARSAAEGIADKGQRIGQTSAFRTISQATEVVKNEMSPRGLEGRVYIAPVALRKRIEVAEDERTFSPDTETTGVELHKDSKFYQQWENFKNNNQYVNKVLDWKIKYEESDNPVVRASRLLTEKMGSLFGNMFEKTELSKTLTEICKIDPNFTAQKFLEDCANDIIPNILEAMVRGDLEILKDWCYEGVFNILATPIKQCKQLGYRLDSKILDIEQIELVMGKMMDQGPVLVITFQSQQIMCVRDGKGNVIEGSPDKVMRVNYVWVLCRDPQELNPKSAWRLLELSANSVEQLI